MRAVARGALWLVMVAYVGWVVHRAHTELHDEYVITGLFRTYRPPRAVPEGWLIDTRPGALTDELAARYRAPAMTPPLGNDRDSWANHMKSLGISVELTTGPGPAPRLLFTPAGPWLQTGSFQGQPTVFDPARGVVLLADAALPLDTPALALPGLEPRPW